ncbi:MAG: hypothetical protein JGK17_28185 [Microcoleus sp. PH2017_10_PVI_O_A]|uniref:hypothetical protein n=1 Tax=unclassified Microcoleus TaxID=2642155 RepID=UPI001DB32FF3|nr:MULTISPECIES: hypothetical protein [unclassified Microcoleus]MCC3409368.1 hypothetical protein [Microcoleus sp. PH2017_10_PVI_O_A]MCC3463609.1 hypothetical protein [Microcoleus sp. PH2017_11_PCY_U_A]MCC3481954.1 hypothetical protein [Microcoleus sp. PH2017_12_PCY_D_A]MCC3531210.1 hypothetical protein [Microcoleus sp. PH2017_21_RUC_O_A]MCC3543501.1 hypothetical protein [Microcoleus sp. PH2017_22_RUC_O_B]
MDDWYTLKLKKMEEFVLTCESIARMSLPYARSHAQSLLRGHRRAIALVCSVE